MHFRVREVYDEKNNLTDKLILEFKNSETDFWYSNMFNKNKLSEELKKMNVVFNKDENYKEWRELNEIHS